MESPEQPPLVLWAIQFEAWSLEDLLDDWLEYLGCGPVSAQFREKLPNDHFGPLTAELLAPTGMEAGDVVWLGIYRDLSSILSPEDPDE
jgi:hypothetical protein